MVTIDLSSLSMQHANRDACEKILVSIGPGLGRSTALVESLNRGELNAELRQRGIGCHMVFVMQEEPIVEAVFRLRAVGSRDRPMISPLEGATALPASGSRINQPLAPLIYTVPPVYDCPREDVLVTVLKGVNFLQRQCICGRIVTAFGFDGEAVLKTTDPTQCNPPPAQRARKEVFEDEKRSLIGEVVNVHGVPPRLTYQPTLDWLEGSNTQVPLALEIKIQVMPETDRSFEIQCSNFARALSVGYPRQLLHRARVRDHWHGRRSASSKPSNRRPCTRLPSIRDVSLRRPCSGSNHQRSFMPPTAVRGLSSAA